MLIGSLLVMFMVVVAEVEIPIITKVAVVIEWKEKEYIMGREFTVREEMVVDN